MNGRYRLSPDQVPGFPAGSDWPDQLRWCLAVMDAEDVEMAFGSSLLSYALRGGLTKKQAHHAHRLVSRVHGLFSKGALACQAAPYADIVVALSPRSSR